MTTHRTGRIGVGLWILGSGLAAARAKPAVPAVRIERVTPEGVLVAVDPAGLGSQAGGVVHVRGVPAEAGRRVELSPLRLKIADERTRFRAADGRGGHLLAVDPTRIRMWSGRVTGAAGSFVFLAAIDGGLYGTIEPGPGRARYTIVPQPEQADGRLRGLVVPQRAGSPAVPPVALCGVDSAAAGPVAPEPRSDGPARGPTTGPPPVWLIDLCVTTDFLFFQLFDDELRAAEYIVLLYGQISAVFLRDVRAVLRLSDVVIQTTPDVPPTDPNGPCDTSEFLSGDRFRRLGGFASLRMCPGDANCFYINGILPDPAVPSAFHYDFVVAAHELGHTAGAPHTHDIGVDDCDRPVRQPRRGTIMSYCSQTRSGGELLTDLRFHTEIQRRIRSQLRRSACLDRDCNLNGVPDRDDIASGASADANANGVPDECEDCNGNGILDDADIAAGTSTDMDNNGVPDECQPDCNGNGVPDRLDIALGTSTDAYGDGVPDECEIDCDGDGVSDYTQLQQQMSLDVDRNAVLDACQDCDGDGISDLEALEGAYNLWVIDNCDGILREYQAASGVRIAELAADAPLDGQDVIIASDGRILVSDGAGSRVVAFDRVQGFLGELVPPGAGGLSFAAGMTLSAEGTLLVASRDTDSVLEFDAVSGAFVRARVAPGAGGLTQPWGVAIGPNGRLYVTSGDDRVIEYDAATGQPLRDFVRFDDNGGLRDARGLAFLPSGNLLVVSSQTRAVLEFDADSGAFVRQFNVGGPAGADTLPVPWSVRIGPDGRVYVSTNVVPPLDESAGLHLTRARVPAFDPVSGWYVRPFVMSRRSDLNCAAGMAFMPDLAGVDCNHNFLPDACDIARGASADINANGVPDECECLGDLNGDFRIDLGDLSRLLSHFGRTGDVSYADGDLDNTGRVDLADLSLLLSRFGEICP